MKLLITGVTGFMGGSIAQFAARQGHDIFGIGNSKQSLPCDLQRYVQADIINSNLSTIIGDFAPDVIFHAAGPASVASSISVPVQDLREAVLSWASVLEGVRLSGIDPLLLIPSRAAGYGNSLEYP